MLGYWGNFHGRGLAGKAIFGGGVCCETQSVPQKNGLAGKPRSSWSGKFVWRRMPLVQSHLTASQNDRTRLQIDIVARAAGNAARLNALQPNSGAESN